MLKPQEQVQEINYTIRELVSDLENEIDDLKEQNESLRVENYLLTEALKVATGDKK